MCIDVIPTRDGGYLTTGFSRSNDGDVPANNGAMDAWTVKLGYPSCGQPTGVAVQNISQTAATVTWDYHAWTQQWQIQYRACCNGAGAVQLAGNGAMETQLSNLTPGTIYQLRVRKSCGNLGVSPWKYKTFTTLQ